MVCEPQFVQPYKLPFLQFVLIPSAMPSNVNVPQWEIIPASPFALKEPCWGCQKAAATWWNFKHTIHVAVAKVTEIIYIKLSKDP